MTLVVTMVALKNLYNTLLNPLYTQTELIRSYNEGNGAWSGQEDCTGNLICDSIMEVPHKTICEGRGRMTAL